METTVKTRLLGLSRSQLEELAAELGQPAYRGRQIFEAAYRQRIQDTHQISTLPTTMRTEMATRGIEVGAPSIEQQFRSSDGTIRYLVALEDGETVETVWMPEGDDG